ncbi:hypothetical protein T01_16058 [Trichinella spiralis]|uniref:Uncharacterized protein n=1 Tax=Trichinella spiralis TaxID=6334 RepID=A0A0V1AXS3_TRISP|nr:hypothetical protein T01_16058 [Trichinella spiralis]
MPKQLPFETDITLAIFQRFIDALVFKNVLLNLYGYFLSKKASILEPHHGILDLEATQNDISKSKSYAFANEVKGSANSRETTKKICC